MGDILDCGARIYALRAFGVREELYRTLRLRIRICHHHDGTRRLAISDHNDDVRRTISIESDVDSYVIKRRNVHVIRLVAGDDDVVVELDRSDANFLAFCDAIEAIAKPLGKLVCVARVRDSDGGGNSSGSDDGEVGRPDGAMAAVPDSRIQTMWDCASCHLANHHDQMQCGECLRHRNDAWQCSCKRVYRLEKRRCTWCYRWRCHLCTFLNESTSPDRCYGCGSDRIL